MTIFWVIVIVLITILLTAAFYHDTYAPAQTQKRHQEELYEVKKQNEILRVRQMSFEELKYYVNTATIFNKYYKNSIKYHGMKEAQKILAQHGYHIDLIVVDSIGNVKKRNGFFIVLNGFDEEVGRKEVEPMERLLGFGIEKLLISRDKTITLYDANFRFINKIELKQEERFLKYEIDYHGRFIISIESNNGNIERKYM